MGPRAIAHISHLERLSMNSVDLMSSKAVMASGRIAVRIADLTLVLASDDPDLTLGVTGAMEAFMTHSDQADMHVLVTWGDGKEFQVDHARTPLFDSGAVWHLSDEGGCYRFRFTSPRFGRFPYKVAAFNRDFTRGTIALNRLAFPAGRPSNPLEYPLDELMLLNMLARGRGVEVHACGVADADGNGSLFLGQSGAGKTTTARIWDQVPGITILSDDRIILRNVGGTIWMYGTPWHREGRLSHPGQVPLRQIYFLRHGSANVLVLQSSSDAMTRMFACSSPLFHSADALDFTLSLLNEITARIPAYELRFFPDRRVLDLLPHSRAC
jgi:hypothetical protein